MARPTPYVTAVMSRNLAHQSEAKAYSTIVTLTHTGYHKPSVWQSQGNR
jgi:hypothetical protein